MFVTALNSFIKSAEKINTNLLEKTDLWPFWFKDGLDSCLALLPSWILVQHQSQTYFLSINSNFSYTKEIVNQNFLEFLKKKFIESNCPTYPINEGFNGGLVGWLSYPSSKQPHMIDFPDLCFGFYDCFIK